MKELLRKWFLEIKIVYLHWSIKRTWKKYLSLDEDLANTQEELKTIYADIFNFRVE